MLFATAVNPFESSEWMKNRALSIPETVQQRRRRYERIAAKVTVALGIASCCRGSFVFFICSCWSSIVCWQKWNEIEVVGVCSQSF